MILKLIINSSNLFMNKFLDIFQNYNVYMCESKIDKNLCNLYFYISDRIIDINLISNNIKTISYIHFIYNLESANLVFLKTKNKYKNKGYASYLLKLSIKYLKIKKIKKIELDDMSNHAHGKNNIYINFGFKYINPRPEPEMLLEL